MAAGGAVEKANNVSLPTAVVSCGFFVLMIIFGTGYRGDRYMEVNARLDLWEEVDRLTQLLAEARLQERRKFDQTLLQKSVADPEGGNAVG